MILRFWSFSPELKISRPFFFLPAELLERWKKPKASSCRQGIILRKQGCQSVRHCDVHTKRFSMHVLLQGERRRGHLKQNFKWQHERHREEAQRVQWVAGAWDALHCARVISCPVVFMLVGWHKWIKGARENKLPMSLNAPWHQLWAHKGQVSPSDLANDFTRPTKGVTKATTQ